MRRRHHHGRRGSDTTLTILRPATEIHEGLTFIAAWSIMRNPHTITWDQHAGDACTITGRATDLSSAFDVFSGGVEPHSLALH